MPFERRRESFTVTCGDCGDECQIPFKPRDARPVYCKECFQKHKPQERGGDSGFNRGSSYGRNDRGSRYGRGSSYGRNDRGSRYGRGSSYGRNDRGSRYGRGPRDDRRRESFTATCADCGNECQLPFKPRDERPVYCKDCFQKHKPQERGGGSGFNRGSSYGRNDRGSRYGRGPRDDRRRESFTATCADCGNECQLPFKPRDERPVYCKDCFQDHKHY